jgi:tRNA(fMet)-specific endonuclease VapC
MILLDTNICVYVLKTRPPEVLERFNGFGREELAISVITAMELRVGAVRADGTHYPERVETLLGALEIVPLGVETIDVFAKTKVDLQRRGELIGPLDLLIAAHALSLDATLVTNNEREFRRVAGLRVENWVKKNT